MQYAHNAFGLEGVKGLGASLFMRYIFHRRGMVIRLYKKCC